MNAYPILCILKKTILQLQKPFRLTSFYFTMVGVTASQTEVKIKELGPLDFLSFSFYVGRKTGT